MAARAFVAGAANQAGDADISRAPGLSSGLQGSVDVNRGATVTVHQLFCILHDKAKSERYKTWLKKKNDVDDRHDLNQTS